MQSALLGMTKGMQEKTGLLPPYRWVAPQRQGMLHESYSRPSGQPRSGHGGELERCGADDAQRAFTANNHE